MGNYVAKNIRKSCNEWEIGGAIRVVAGGKIILDGGAIDGIREVPATGTNGHYLKKTSDGYSFAALPDAGATTKGLVKQAALVAEAAGANPTATEFKALLDALKAAGIMANA